MEWRNLILPQIIFSTLAKITLIAQKASRNELMTGARNHSGFGGVVSNPSAAPNDSI
jgi:hypothetical protein